MCEFAQCLDQSKIEFIGGTPKKEWLVGCQQSWQVLWMMIYNNTA